MAKLKGLRGTPFDPFGYMADRKLERALIGEYEALIRSLAGQMTPERLDVATQIAAAPALVAGYGPVKEAGVIAYRARVEELLAAFRLENAAGNVTTAPEIA
jgi:indolepyruvate ferredoxin oxidoreductase